MCLVFLKITFSYYSSQRRLSHGISSTWTELAKFDHSQVHRLIPVLECAYLNRWSHKIAINLTLKNRKYYHFGQRKRQKK